MQDPTPHSFVRILLLHAPGLTCQLLAPSSRQASAPLWRRCPTHGLPGDRAPPRGGRGTPPPRPHPGLRKQSPEKEKESRHPGRVEGRHHAHSALPPGPSPQGLRAGAAAPLKPPFNCHLDFPTPFSATQRKDITCPGSHCRSGNQLPISGLWGSKSLTPVVPPGSARPWGHSPTALF